MLIKILKLKKQFNETLIIFDLFVCAKFINTNMICIHPYFDLYILYIKIYTAYSTSNSNESNDEDNKLIYYLNF